MKNRYLLLKTLSLLLITIAVASCSMKTVRFNGMRPADIDVPSSIDTLLLVNRTLFKSEAVNIIEGVLTGEMPGEDKAGTQAAMNTLQVALGNSNRFVVKNASETIEGNSITAAFPAPLHWTQVEWLCSKYNTHALLAIELFDTDYIITDGERDVEREVGEGRNRRTETRHEFFARGVANINIGFRIYDPKNKTIIDQQSMRLDRTWEATGTSIQDALVNLTAKAQATRIISEMAGNAYARKIAPTPITISRAYYKKSKKVPSVAVGVRQAEVNDWIGAVATWKNALNTTADRKESGKIAYNIAVGYEVVHDLVNAKLWANEAYVKYGNKKARQLASQLERRIIDENRLRQQME